MKLSIIMPSKNEAEGIAYALEGWIRICEGLDYEIIVVDDSDDETPKIVKKFTEKYENIRLINGERKGVGCFEDEKVDLVYSSGKLWVTESLLANACSIARIDFDVSSVAFAYRRSVFKELPISKGITVGEDMDMFLTALKNARKKGVSNEPILFFAPVFNLKDLIGSHIWYGKEYLTFAKKHKKQGLINIGGCFVYFIAALLLLLTFVNWIFAMPFIVGVLGEYVRQLKKFNICRKRGLLIAWFFVPVPAYIQRIAFSVGFVSGLLRLLKKR